MKEKITVTLKLSELEKGNSTLVELLTMKIQDKTKIKEFKIKSAIKFEEITNQQIIYYTTIEYEK